MAKLPHQSTVPPVGNQDAATKDYADAAGGVDTTAIHKATAGEIAVLTEKTTPVGGDHLLIEDSENANAKARILMSNVLGGSSGPIAAAQGAFIEARLSTDQVADFAAANTVVLFDTAVRSSGELEVDGSGVFTGLKAGRTYLLTAEVQHNDASVQRIPWCWYDRTNAQLLGSVGVSWSPSIATNNGYPRIARAVIRPTTDISVDVRNTDTPSGGGTLDVIADNGWGEFNSHAQIIEIGAVQADVVGGLEFMDIIEVTAAQTSVSFGAAGDGAFQRALDGDVDEEYVLVSVIVNGNAPTTGEFVLRPNGISTNQESEVVQSSSGAVSAGGGPYTNILLFRSSFDNGYGTCQMLSKTGTDRMASTTGVGSDDASANAVNQQIASVWSDSSTVISSLDIVSLSGAHIGIGSRFKLYRRTTNNLRADSAAVYERMAVETITPGALVTTERTVGHSIYGGSVVGVSARIEKTITGGSVTVNVKVDGSTVLSTVLDTSNPTSKVERLAIGQAKFAADKNISVEFVPAGVGFAPPSVPVPVTVQVHLTNDALITQNDRVVAKTVLSADATTISVTGLNGDLDELYEIEGTLFLIASANNMLIAPNSDTASLKSARSPNGTYATSSDGNFVISGAVASNEFSFRCLAYVSRTKNGTSRVRTFQFTASHYYGGAPNVNTHISTVAYEDGTANLTSLDFTCSVASGILAGSEVVVRRVKA